MKEPSEPNEPDSTDKQEHKPGLFQLILSIMAGAIGVQSDRNRERDFERGDFRRFVIGGVVFTTLLILTLIALVRWIIST